MYNILICDDERDIVNALKIYLSSENYNIFEAFDGQQAVDIVNREDIHLILMDIMMPKKDGIAAMTEIRKDSNIPVIMITAKGDVFDKVLGLELGADDFIVKPFDLKELSARIKAVLRRYNAHAKTVDDEVVQFENIEISLQRYELKLNGQTIAIPPKELELLYFLASNCNRVFTRDQLLDKVWGFDYLGDSRTVDVHVKRLREKLEGVSEKWSLDTVWGVGYKFKTLI